MGDETSIPKVQSGMKHANKVCRDIVQSIWGQNGLNPPQIATKIKLALCCREFCKDFRKQKFIKINRVEYFQIA